MAMKPLVALWGWFAGGLLLLVWGLLRATVRVRHIDRFTGHSIQCAWHEALLPYFVACMPYRQPAVWLNHPLWIMKGVHVFLMRMGVKLLALGSSGHGGRQALEQLLPWVQEGASTFLNPDGPAGPPRALKPGVLDMGERTGVPVVALRLECSAAFRLRTWDRKIVPWPGSRIDVHYSPPMHITATNRESAARALASFMSQAPSSPASSRAE